MSFDIPSNHARAQKIVDILGHVERSANANKATADEIAAILAPAVDALRALGAIPPDAPPAPEMGGLAPDAPDARQVATERPEAPLSAGQRAALTLACQASLRELIASLIARLDCHAARLGEPEPEAET